MAIKKPSEREGFCCEGWDRTTDLRVMSPTSYRCSTSRCGQQIYGKHLSPQTIFNPLILAVNILTVEVRIRKHFRKAKCREEYPAQCPDGGEARYRFR